MKKIRKLSVKYNDFDIPYIKIKKNAHLTYDIQKNGIEIIGNRIGLKLLAKALLGIAESERNDGFHIHIDDIYNINEDNKNFTISKKG